MNLNDMDTRAAANQGVDLVLRNPFTDEDTDITIHVLGRDSDAFKRIESQQMKRRLDRMQKQRKPETVSLDEVDENGLALLAACTTGWTNLDLDGRPLDFSEANAATVYQRFPWIREQVDKAIGDRSVFTTPKSVAFSPSLSTSSD